MRTRTRGIQLLDNGERLADKHYRDERIFERLGRVSQDEAEAWLKERQALIDDRHENQLREGDEQLFAAAAQRYLIECKTNEARSLETISGHVLLLNEWVGHLPMRSICNDSFATFKADRLEGRGRAGQEVRKVKPATVNRTLEVARTVMNRAARVWRTENGKPWLAAAPLIEMLDEKATRRPPYPITWAEQTRLMPTLPAHLQRMVLFMLNTGARDENVCGLRWSWEVPVKEIGRSVFLIPADEFKSKRAHVLILNDVAWQVIEECRGKHADFVFVYRRERVKHVDQAPAMQYRRVDTVNNTAFQAARSAAKLSKMRVHDLRHTYAQRLRDAGVHSEDRALLLGHSIGGMPQHYATATVARLVEVANQVAKTTDRTTLLRVMNG